MPGFAVTSDSELHLAGGPVSRYDGGRLDAKDTRLKSPWDRGGLRSYLVVLALVFCRPDHRTLLWGLPLLILGTGLQIYSKGCLQQDQAVAQGGPYRFVRHPFYAANLLVDFGIALMSGWWPLIAGLLPWWLAVYIPVMAGEERHLTTLFPDTYPAYQQRLPRLLPLRRPLPKPEHGFSWGNRNIIADTVIPRALRNFALPLAIFLVQQGKAAGVRSLLAPEGLVAAAAMLILFGVSRQLARHLKNRGRLLPER
jgi:hypothetical protein